MRKYYHFWAFPSCYIFVDAQPIACKSAGTDFALPLAASRVIGRTQSIRNRANEQRVCKALLWKGFEAYSKDHAVKQRDFQDSMTRQQTTHLYSELLMTWVTLLQAGKKRIERYRRLMIA